MARTEEGMARTEEETILETTTMIETIFSKQAKRDTPENVLGVLKNAIKVIQEADAIFDSERTECDRRTEKMLQNKDEAVAKILMQIVQDLQGAVAAREQERTLEITRMTTEFDAKLDQYSGLLTDANKKVEGLQAEMAKRAEAWQKERADLENQVKKAKQDGADRLKQAQKTAEDRLKRAQEKAQQAMDNTVAKYGKEIAGLEETLQAEVKIREQRDKEIVALKQERTDIIAMWRDKCDKQAEDAKRDLQKRMDIAEEHLQKVKAHLEAQLAQARNDIKNLKDAFAKKEAEFNQAMEAELSAEHQTMAELAAVKEARDALLAEKERQIRELHDIVELKILEIQELHALHKAAMEETEVAALLVLKEVTDGYEARLAALLLEHAAIVTTWEEKCVAFLLRIEQMEKEHEKAMLMTREAFDTDVAAIKAMCQKQLLDMQALLDGVRAALELEKDNHLADVAKAVEDGVAAVMVQAAADQEQLLKVRNDLVAQLKNLQNKKEIMENDLNTKIARLQEAMEKLKKDDAERLAAMDAHYNELLESQKNEADQHLGRLSCQIEVLHAALGTEKAERKLQVDALNKVNKELLAKKEAEIANLIAANKIALDELNAAWERKMQAARDDFNRKLNAKAKQLEKVKQDDVKIIELLKIEMAEALAAAELVLLARIAADDEAMAVMRLEYKAKVEFLELRMVEEAAAAVLVLELKDKELIDAKAVWLLEVAKLKEEYELMIANELGAEHALQAEVARLKKKLQEALDKAAAEKAKLQQDMKDQAEKAVAQDKALVAEYEDKLERLRNENANRLANERAKADKALADRDEKYRKLQVEDQGRLQKKAQELAQAKVDAKKEMERLAAEALAAITALEIELTEKLHKRDERMAEMEKEFLAALAAEEAKHEAYQLQFSEIVKSKEQTWMKELDSVEVTLNSQIAALQKQNENLRADCAALAAAAELELAALVKEHNEKVLAMELLAVENLALMEKEKDDARALWMAVQKDLAAMEMDYKNKLSLLKQEMERALAVLAAEKDLEMEKVGAAARLLVEERQKDCDARIQSIRADAKEKEAKLRHKIDELHAQMRNDSEARAAEKEQMQQSFNSQLAAVQAKCAKNIEAMKDASAQEVAALTAAYEAKLSKMDAVRKEEIAAQELTSQQKIKQALDAELKYKKWLEEETAVDHALKNERDMLKESMAKLQQDADKNASLAAYQADKDARALKEAIQEERTKFDQKILLIEAACAWKCEEAEMRIEEVCAAKEIEFLAKIAAVAEQLAMWQAKHDQLVKEHEAILIALEEEQKMQLAAAVLIVEQQLQQTQLQLEKMKKDRNQALSDKDKSCSDMRHEYELHLDEANRKFHDEVAAVKSQALADLHNKDDELKAAIAAARQKLDAKDTEMGARAEKADVALARKEAAIAETVAQCEEKIKAFKERLEQKEAELAAAFAQKAKAMELAAAEKDEAQRKALEKKDKELKDFENRTNMKYASLAKESQMLKDRVAAKEKEIADSLDKLLHAEEIKAKELAMLEAKLLADIEARVNRYEAALRDLEAAKLRELEIVKQDLIALKLKELSELRTILEQKIKEAEAAKIIAVEEAVAVIMADKIALIAEKEKLEMNFAQLEAEMAKVMEKELSAEAQIENKASRVLKEASANQKKYEADLKSVKHELEVSEAQKQRLREDQAAALEKAKRGAGEQVATVEKELDIKVKEERRKAAAKEAELQEKLKAKDRELAAAQVEIGRLTDTLVNEGIDETIEIDVEIVEEVIIVQK